MLQMRDVVTIGNGGESVAEHGVGTCGGWLAACLVLLEREKEETHD